jgi:hypothetical protein
MSARWRLVAAALLSLLAFSYHGPAAIQNLRFLLSDDHSVLLPFRLEPLRPVISDFERHKQPENLFEGDRVISINGQAIDSPAALGRALADLTPESGLAFEVEHYPPDAPAWPQFVFVSAADRASSTIRYYAFFLGILLPLLCLGLAAKPMENRTWLFCGALLFCAQLA